MPVAQAQGRRAKLGNPSSRPSTGGGGNGGNGLSFWKGWGDKNGDGYRRAHQGLSSVGGPRTEVVQAFQKATGVKDLFNPGLISPEVAGRAKVFGTTDAPRFVEGAKAYFDGLDKSSDADLKIKERSIKTAMHYSANLVNQSGQDHAFAQHQMNAVVAHATQSRQTLDEYQLCQGSLTQLASTAQGL